MRKQLAGLVSDNRWAQIRRWFLAEPSQRPQSPYAAVDKRPASDNTPPSSRVPEKSPAG